MGRAETIVSVTHPAGLHARPAALFVQLAGRFLASIYIEKDGRRADAKSILSILGLAVSTGTIVRIIAEGPDADQAVNALRTLVESGFEKQIESSGG